MVISVTIIVIIITCIVSIVAFGNQEMFNKYKFNPYLVKHRGEYVRIIGHALLHADYMHLFFNMYVLYSFGGALEKYFIANYGFEKGISFWLLIYIGGILFSIIPSYKKHVNDHYYNSVGASGAVSAVLFSIILLFPTIELYLLFIPIGIPAFIMGFLYLLYESAMNKRGGSNIAHDAHIGGALFGLVINVVINWRVVPRFLSQVADYFLGFFQ